MGANGAGKSTLVKILTGAVHPDERHDPRPRRALRGPLARRGPTRRRRLRLPGAGPHPGPGHPIEPAPDRDAVGAVPPLARRNWASPTWTWPMSRATCPWRPCGSSTWRARSRSSRHVLMLDEMTAALPADLTERVLEVIAGPARLGPLHHLHLAPAHRDRRGLRPRDRPARRRDGRRRGRDRGLRRPDRRA